MAQPREPVPGLWCSDSSAGDTTVTTHTGQDTGSSSEPFRISGNTELQFPKHCSSQSEELQVFWGTSGIDPSLCELRKGKSETIFRSPWQQQKSHPKAQGPVLSRAGLCVRDVLQEHIPTAGAHPKACVQQELWVWALLGAAPGAREEEEEGRAHCCRTSFTSD